MDPISPEAIMGRSLKDMYGRYVGVVAGVSIDDAGNVTSVLVDKGHDGSIEFGIDRLAFEEGEFTLVPEWRLKAGDISKTISLSRKKLQALEDLYREGELSQLAYEELSGSYKEQLNRYLKECEETASKLKGKVADIECESKALEGFLGRLKLQHKMGGVDDSILQATKEYVIFMLERNKKEAQDISSTLEVLASPEYISEELNEAVEVAPIQDSKPTDEEFSVQESGIEAGGEKSVYEETVTPISEA